MIGESEIGEVIVERKKVKVVQEKGQKRMGREVGKRMEKSFEREIIEIGGKNEGIV